MSCLSAHHTSKHNPFEQHHQSIKNRTIRRDDRYGCNLIEIENPEILIGACYKNVGHYHILQMKVDWKFTTRFAQ